MGKLILSNFVTVDGFFEGQYQELDWHQVDDEFQQFGIQQLNAAETLVFGRKTYEVMRNYWTTKEAMLNDPIIAEKMNACKKVVFSNTLSRVAWTNSVLTKSNIEDVIADLKDKSDKDILIFGSANLSSTFQRLNLIDEYRVMVNPIILGAGIPLFKPDNGRKHLKLIHTKTFTSGMILLSYEPK
jgi:dihydrofolate reductase